MSEEEFDEELEKHLKVKYSSETCLLCNSRIDDYGYCACGAGGE